MSDFYNPAYPAQETFDLKSHHFLIYLPLNCGRKTTLVTKLYHKIKK